MSPKPAPTLLIPKASLVVRRAQALGGGCDDQAHNQAVQTQRLRKNEDEDHTNEQARLLRVCANACITNNANGEACSETAHANCEAGTQVRIAGISRVVRGVHPM